MIFGVTAKKLISHDDAASEGSLWKCFDACTRGCWRSRHSLLQMHAGKLIIIYLLFV
jgi:hypothetical protein